MPRRFLFFVLLITQTVMEVNPLSASMIVRHSLVPTIDGAEIRESLIHFNHKSQD